MSDARTLAIRAVALKVLADRVAAELDSVKRQIVDQGELDEGDRKQARLDSKTSVGYVLFTKGRTTARVVNEPQLTKWVQENYPDEIVPTIRPSFKAAILGDAQKLGQPITTEGEVLPGVDIVQGDGYISIKPDPAQLPALLEAIRDERDFALQVEP